MNWHSKIEKIEEILTKWSKRDLSLIGRVQIIKTFALSQITLPASTLPIPENIISKLNSILFKFLWKTNDKIKRIKMIKSMKHGGVGMVDIQCYFESIKASWINRIMNAKPDKHNWVQIPYYFLNSIGFDCNELIYNFDNTVNFLELNHLPLFYKEAIQYYNKIHVTNLTDFKHNIANQPIWGNKFITIKHGKRKNILFFRDWIRSGVRKISDLRFRDGVLDENYIYNTIRNQQNIYMQIAIVKKALLPYRNTIQNINVAQGANTTETVFNCITTKQIYRKMLEEKTEHISPTSDYLFMQGFKHIEFDMFYTKVFLEREVKLKEFNLKLLHGILPCNRNLKRWRLKDSDICDTCNEIQSIEHLLFECNYVQPLWNKINEIFNVNITFNLILGVNKLFPFNNVLTVISFLIYKEWLIDSLENKPRRNTMAIGYFKAELQLRVDIYKKCPNINEHHIVLLEILIEKL